MHAHRLRQRRTLRRPGRRRCSSSPTPTATRGRRARGPRARSTPTCRPATTASTLQKPGFGAKRVRMTPHVGRAVPLPPARPTACSATPGRSGSASGEQSEFRVHSVEPYKLELWRYGWEPRSSSAASAGTTSTARAPRCRSRPTATTRRPASSGTRSATPARSTQQYVAAPGAQRALLLPRLDRRPGGSFAFPWVVAPAKPTAPDRGAGLEHHLERLQQLRRPQQLHQRRRAARRRRPSTPAPELKRYTDAELVTWGRDELRRRCRSSGRSRSTTSTSAEQITDPIEGRQACHLAPAEWRLLGWLEREGFAYDLYAETQLHDGALDLRAYRVLVLSVHPEYWTRRMYDRVKRVGLRGGRPADVPRRQRPQLRGRAAARRRDASCHNTADREPVARRAWAAPRAGSRMRHESEANLLGVVFTPAGAMTGRAVPRRRRRPLGLRGHRAEERRPLRREVPAQRCPGGASGHETDKISPSSPKNVRLLAKGLNPDDGGAEMVIFDTPGGRGGVLGRLDLLAELAAGRRRRRDITANVLRRFLE